MKKILLFYCFIVLLFYCSSVYAQEATSPTPTLDPIRKAVQENIKSRATGKPYAFVGTIKTLANLALTIETKNGIKQASTSAETTLFRIIKKTKKEIEFSDLELQESVIAMGYLNESGALDVKRLIATEITPPPTREIVTGNISEIEKSVLTIKGLKDEETWEIKIDAKTEMTRKEEGEMTEIELEDIGLDDRLIAICKPSEADEPLTALRLHLLRP